MLSRLAPGRRVPAMLTLLLALAALAPIGGGRPAAASAVQHGRPAAPAPAAAPGDLSGILSPAQATRGARLFAGNCAQCHANQQPAQFALERWHGKSFGEFVDHVRKTMPPEGHGGLEEQDYLDILAFSFSALGLGPTGAGATAGQAQWRSVILPAELAGRAGGERRIADRDWTHYRGDGRSQAYTPADQIDAGNVGSLKVVWRWSGRNFGPSPELRNITTPLAVGGRLFFTAGARRHVVAVDAATGETLWTWRPDEGQRFDSAPRKGSGRGVAYWQDEGGRGRILTVTPGFHLVALDAVTGRPVAGFGTDGVVDLMRGLRGADGEASPDIGSSSPPLVVGDVVVVGPAHLPGTVQKSKRNVKGDVRGFDARSGRQLWVFHTVPEAGDPAAKSWKNGANLYTGNAGVWAPMSADPELGLVYLPVETATNDYYGGMRPGAALYSDSLVCLDARTGKLRWYFQTVHHDIWDRDLPAAPILLDIPGRKGRIRAVAQLTKQAFTFVFDRVSGKPLWPIVERPVPKSDVPGEETSPTQPFPTLPLPFDRQGFSDSDLVDFTPAIRAAARQAVAPFRPSELYTPFSLANAKDGTRGTMAMPFSWGGANWEGGAADPDTGMIYVPSSTHPYAIALEPAPPGSDSGYVASFTNPTVEGIPVVKPPWGRITAIDLKTGKHQWMQPNGEAPDKVRQHKLLAGVAIGRTGKPTRAGLLATKTLLFAGEGWGGAPVLRAHDKQSGKVIAEIPLPGSQTGVPMSYVWQGRQYVAMSIGDGENPAEVIALALP